MRASRSSPSARKAGAQRAPACRSRQPIHCARDARRAGWELPESRRAGRAAVGPPRTAGPSRQSSPVAGLVARRVPSLGRAGLGRRRRSASRSPAWRRRLSAVLAEATSVVVRDALGEAPRPRRRSPRRSRRGRRSSSSTATIASRSSSAPSSEVDERVAERLARRRRAPRRSPSATSSAAEATAPSEPGRCRRRRGGWRPSGPGEVACRRAASLAIAAASSPSSIASTARSSDAVRRA